MLSDNFLRLPESIQQKVLAGLEEEIRVGFQEVERAKADTSVEDHTMRAISEGIVRSGALRDSLTGEVSSQ
ncbi:MAG: hypothetical protein ACTIJ6_00435 [Leucobacter sp.]